MENLVEELSLVEKILAQDPSEVYPGMDSSSRGMYRNEIEKLAINCKLQEIDVAKTCLELAQEGHDDVHYPHHVGSYLLGRIFPIKSKNFR